MADTAKLEGLKNFNNGAGTYRDGLFFALFRTLFDILHSSSLSKKFVMPA